MDLPPSKQAALLVGAGGAGAASMLALLLGDLQGEAPSVARVGTLAFALLLSVPLMIALQAALRPSGPAPREVRALLAFGTFLWLGGVGVDLFVPTLGAQLRTAAHAAALLGGVALAAAGLWIRAPSAQGRAARRRREREQAP